MMTSRLPIAVAVPLLVLTLTSGCGRDNAKSVEVIAAKEVPHSIEKAFAGAPDDARKAASELSNNLESQPADAFFGFQSLSYRPDLTSEQRTAVAQAILAAHERLVAEAAKGSASAREALEQQAARK